MAKKLRIGDGRKVVGGIHSVGRARHWWKEGGLMVGNDALLGELVLGEGKTFTLVHTKGVEAFFSCGLEE